MKKLKQGLKNKKGFTLVELITVIVILGILMVLVVPTFNSVIDRADRANIEGVTRNAYVSATANATSDRDLKGGTPSFTIKDGEIHAGGKIPDGKDLLTDKDITTGLNGGLAENTYRATAAADAGLEAGKAGDLNIYVDGSGNIAVDYTDGEYTVSMYKSEITTHKK